MFVLFCFSLATSWLLVGFYVGPMRVLFGFDLVPSWVLCGFHVGF